MSQARAGGPLTSGFGLVSLRIMCGLMCGLQRSTCDPASQGTHTICATISLHCSNELAGYVELRLAPSDAAMRCP
ncbi:hypothetical protein K491DRAFT_325562 [Lophiostoma macrostomum CBS 122681]|uniref:Secreted protein n=1 Tax=Lophiostoma macrostomum CBS 122681 TaxID=1314788 RepID=A0A6A6SJN5_9PLEO|nr:hypothetical protein K491DRAFT_325562 [Lophiostoma macrostomum CBS 122681]